MIAYHLQPATPFHFGERGIGYEETSEFLHSDTLFAALVTAWQLNRGYSLTELLGPLFSPTSPMRLTSAFPYAGPVRFLPRPLIPLFEADAQQLDPKLGKKIEWVSWRRLEDIINSNTPPRVQAEDLLMAGRVWLHPADRQTLEAAFGQSLQNFRIWSVGEAETIPRVAIDRVNNTSALYYQGQVRFAEGCGLYLLAEFDPAIGSRYRRAVADGLALLGEQGLGGRRSVGLGQFELEEIAIEEPLEQPGVNEPAYHLLLSLYHPTQAEVQSGALSQARYRLLTRRGWFFSEADTGQRRRAVRMLAEGSLLALPVTGDITDVAPAGYTAARHPVYRSGLALTVRCRRWPDV